MKRIKIFNNQLTESIKTIINEELGISDLVVRTTYEIFNVIKKSIAKTNGRVIFDNSVIFKSGDFKYVFCNRTINVIWQFYNFKDEEDLIKHRVNDTGRLDYSNLKLTVIIYAMKNKINRGVILQSIQHEIEHLYERSMRKDVPYPKVEDYNFVARQGIVDENNVFIEAIKNIVYLSQVFEQRAYVNGLYAFLMEHGNSNNLQEVVKKNTIWIALENLKYYVEILENADRNNAQYQEMLHFIETFFVENQSIEKLIKHGKQAISSISHYIGRIIAKAKKDCIQRETQPTIKSAF